MFFHNLKIDENFLNNIPKIIENNKSYELDELSHPGWR